MLLQSERVQHTARSRCVTNLFSQNIFERDIAVSESISVIKYALLNFKLTRVQRFAGRLSEENRQGIPCGFVSTLHITTSGLIPALWFIQCTCTLQNHKVHPVCFLLTTYLQSAVALC